MDAACVLAAALVGAGYLLRLGLRDRVDGLAILFYATPWPVISAGATALSGLLFCRRKRAASSLSAAAAISALLLWFDEGCWIHRAASPNPDALRVVLWNVARPVTHFPKLAGILRELNADYIAIAEAEPQRGWDPSRWREAFPEHHVEMLPGNMICLVRGTVIERKSGRLAPGSHYAHLRLEMRQSEMNFIQVDLNASPGKSRRLALATLSALVAKHSSKPLVVLGDFNTPRQSFHLDAFRHHLTHAFEAAGHGFAETWPMPVPVLGLDQIWTSRTLRTSRCTHGGKLHSDHRSVIAEIVPAADESPTNVW